MFNRFYFDIAMGSDTLRDEIGVEAADLAEALAEARSAIAEVAAEVDTDVSGEPFTLIVRNEAGAPVGALPISR